MLTFLTFLSAVEANSYPAPHAGFRLRYAPKTTEPVYAPKRNSTNGKGRLHELQLNNNVEYISNAISLLEVQGDPAEVGEAYGELLAKEIQTAYNIQMNGKLDLVPVLDFLWDCALLKNAPLAYVEELEGIKKGGEILGVKNLDKMVIRVLVGATLPADTQNIEKLLEKEALRHYNISACGKRGRDLVNELAWEAPDNSMHPPGHCDFFACWGSRTEGGRLLSSRNLDIDHDTGLAKHKLITVYRLSGQSPYATFGFSGFAGALAGMSKSGMTVSEANLDNGDVGFDGLAWPLRLREVLGRATSVDEAKTVWAEGGANTAAFNFLLASASDAKPTSLTPAAVALETKDGFTAFFSDDSPVEAAATFGCVNGTVVDGSVCKWPFNGNGSHIDIGMPMRHSVWRSNHALHPRLMNSQENLWNDTVMRYYLLHDRIADASGGATSTSSHDDTSTSSSGSRMGVEAAINITSLLGIKGEDYGSCERDNIATLGNSGPAIVLSVVYDPSRYEAYVAWEDGQGTVPSTNSSSPPATWTPASCNTYVKVNFMSWFDSYL